MHWLIFLLLLIQFGLNTAASVAVLGLAALLYINRNIRQSDASYVILLSSFLGIALCLSIFSAKDVDIDLLREIRTVICTVLIGYFMTRSVDVDEDRVARCVTACLAILLVWVLLQKFSVLGQRWVVPAQMYAISDDGALASVALRKAAIGQYFVRLRPSALFSEPSYLGLVTLGLLALGVNSARPRWVVGIIVMALAICIISTSLLATLGCVAFAALFAIRQGSFLNVVRSLFAVALIGLVIGATPAIRSRLSTLSSGDDVSATIRLVRPFELIQESITSSPFGIPQTAALEFFRDRGLITATEDAPLQNGLLNLFVFYGILAVPLLYLLLSRCRNIYSATFFIFALMQNGSIGSFDKAFLIGLIACLLNPLVDARLSGKFIGHRQRLVVVPSIPHTSVKI